jgi:hypothetical protein
MNPVRSVAFGLFAFCAASAVAQDDEIVPRRTANTAADKQLELWVGHGESDNIADQSAPIRGGYNSAGVAYDMDRAGERFELGLATNLEFRQYDVDFLENEQLGNLDLLADVKIIPTRFSWSFQDDYGQQRTNALGANSPQNREDFNVFTTGPLITLPLGNRTQLALRATYSDRKFEESLELDSTQLLREIGVNRQVSRTTLVGLSAQKSEFDYDLSIPPYEIDTLLLRYSKTLREGELDAQLGKNELMFAGNETSGPVARISWSRNVTARSQLSLSGSRELTDSGALLALGVGRIDSDSLATVQDVLLSPSPLEFERVGVAYVFRLMRTNVAASVSRYNEAYEVTPLLDNKAADLQLSVGRILTARLQLRFDAGILKRDFTALNQTADDKIRAIALDRTFGSRFRLGLRLENAERTGQDAFARRSWEIRWVYMPGGARTQF